MRLTGRSEDEPLSEVWAYLTATEAIYLFEALAIYFEDAHHHPGWHHHIGGDGGIGGGGGPELTIAIDT